MVILLQDCYVMGKENSKKFYQHTVGNKFQIGNAFSYTMKNIFLICACGQNKTGWKETKYLSDVESTQQRS